MKVLIIPGAFYSSYSGAVAAREAIRLLISINYEVAVYVHEKQNKEVSDIKYFRAPPYNGYANFRSKRYKETLREVIIKYKPNYFFFIGQIINTPRVYYELANKHNIKAISLLLIQDFFCAGIRTIIKDEKKLTSYNDGFIYFLKKAIKEKTSHELLYYLNFQLNKGPNKRALLKSYKVLGSSDEQLRFYLNYGFNSKQISKIPLFFPKDRISTEVAEKGDYFVILAQNRIDKGINIIPKILHLAESDIRIKVLFYSEFEKNLFVRNYPNTLKILHKSKNIELLGNSTMDNDGKKLVANAFGIINPSMWSTTTEFVLLEALGLKKPIFVFDVGIHKEVIKNGYNGFIAKRGDAEQMANQINEFYHNQENYNDISNNAYDLFLRLTSESAYVSVLEKIFI